MILQKENIKHKQKMSVKSTALNKTCCCISVTYSLQNYMLQHKADRWGCSVSTTKLVLGWKYASKTQYKNISIAV